MAFYPHDAGHFCENCYFHAPFWRNYYCGFFFGTLKGEARLEWYKNILFGMLFIAFLLALLIWSNKTYKISFDESAVYMGGVKWRWNRLGYVRVENMMRYDDIAELGAGQGQGILPLAYIAILRRGSEWDSGEKFFVSRYQLKDDDVREFAEYLYTKIPEKFPPELIEFINDGTVQE